MTAAGEGEVAAAGEGEVNVSIFTSPSSLILGDKKVSEDFMDCDCFLAMIFLASWSLFLKESGELFFKFAR